MIDGDPDVRVAILTGAGGDFSAGADLDRLVGALMSGKPAQNEFEERIRNDFSLIFKGFLKEYRTKKPLVAAVEGYCYAGGLEILQATDIRVAAEGAKIGLTEVQRGLFPMAGTTVRLPRQIPWTKAMEIMLIGDPITGTEAETPGPRRPRRARRAGPHQGPGAGREDRRQRAAGRAGHQGLGAGRRRPARGRGLSPRRRRSAWRSWPATTPRRARRAFLEKRPANFTGT